MFLLFSVKGLLKLCIVINNRLLLYLFKFLKYFWLWLSDKLSIIFFFLVFSAKLLLKLCIAVKMLNGCTSFRVQNISNNGFQVHSSYQCFSSVLGKRIVKTIHCYTKCLAVVHVIVFKLFPTMAFRYTLNNKVFLLLSAIGLL